MLTASTLRFRTLALLAALAAPAAAQVAGPPSGRADTSATPESALVPGLADVAADSAGAVAVLSDSAAVRLDSAAVAALADTTQTLADALGEGVAVDLLGRRLFEVWGGLGDVSVEDRAARLSGRLAEIARNREIDPSALRIADGASLTTLILGDLIVMTVTDEDARALGLRRTDAARRYRQQIVDGVAHYREQATLRGVSRSATITAALFVALLLALRGLGWLWGWLDRRTARGRRRLVRPVRIGTFEVVGRDQVRRLGSVVARLGRLAASLVLVYAFLTTALGLFPWTQAWSDDLLDIALSPLRSLGAMLLGSIDNLIAIGVVVLVVRWTIRFSDYLFGQVARGEVEIRGFHAELADPTRKIVKFLLVVAGAMLIYPYTPVADSLAFQGLTVFFGLLISLGSSSAISNMVAGVVLTYTRAFRVGDRVKVGDTFGDVVEKTFLVTRVRTPKNEDVSVPNATVLANHIVNYSVMAREGSGVVLHTEVTIGYDVPWPDVHRLLVQAARDTDGLEPEPPPFVLQTGLGDFSVAYELNAYTREVTRMARLYSDLHQHVQDRFAEAGVEILSPTYHARRDAPSTVPDVAAVQDARARAQATAPASATDGADAAPLPEGDGVPDVGPLLSPGPLAGRHDPDARAAGGRAER